jgi:hypothetical protein
VIALAGVVLVCAAASGAAAQEATEDMTEYVTEDLVVKPPKEEAFDATLSTNAGVALTSNKDVVGEVDGFSTLFSLGINGGLEYVKDANLWTNTLTITESWARTPTLDRFVKNNDQLEFESLYNYFLLDWFGPFARFNLATSAFDTTVVTAEPETYAIARLDGTVDTRTATELHLADSLEPLTLSESIGLFAEPVRRDALTWKLRIGAGARETFAHGVLAGKDDDATADVIEIIELDDVFQAGLEAFTGVEGKIGEGRLTYFAGASALMPFLNNDEQDRSAFDLLRWGVKAGLSMGVTEWMGLNYSLDLLNDPQLLDEVQIQNNLLVTFQYTLIEPDKGPEPTPEELAAEYLEKAKQAEAKAAEYRKKAKQAEAKADKKVDNKTAEGA